MATKFTRLTTHVRTKGRRLPRVNLPTESSHVPGTHGHSMRAAAAVSIRRDTRSVVTTHASSRVTFTCDRPTLSSDLLLQRKQVGRRSKSNGIFSKSLTKLPTSKRFDSTTATERFHLNSPAGLPKFAFR